MKISRLYVDWEEMALILELPGFAGIHRVVSVSCHKTWASSFSSSRSLLVVPCKPLNVLRTILIRVSSSSETRYSHCSAFDFRTKTFNKKKLPRPSVKARLRGSHPTYASQTTGHVSLSGEAYGEAEQNIYLFQERRRLLWIPLLRLIVDIRDSEPRTISIRPFEVVQESLNDHVRYGDRYITRRTQLLTPCEIRSDVYAVDVDGFEHRLRVSTIVIDPGRVLNDDLGRECCLILHGKAVFRDAITCYFVHPVPGRTSTHYTGFPYVCEEVIPESRPDRGTTYLPDIIQ